MTKNNVYFCYNYDQFCYLFFKKKLKYIFSGKTKDDRNVTLFPITTELQEAIAQFNKSNFH
ncbi:hypothetical protein [Niallia sp. FSL M8-0099]|uniref:hypothetical protein n=1 Tax=Niallia sp. FSL M8-0099 TaxID=2954519 RepID=UPI0030F5E53A